MSYKILLLFCLSLLVSFVSCNKDDEEDDPNTSTHVFDQTLLNSNNLISSVTLIEATMSDGSTADCYQVVFKCNPVGDGPYCPETINDIGGVGIYDGNTNPGFQVMKAALWDAMEADGYDIVDENGNISIADPGSGAPPSGGACLEAAPDANLELTFLIPAAPKNASSNDEIEIVENVGVSVDGIPLTGHPPSATQTNGGPGGGGAIPSIDPCGGHIDPFGYYHLHFGAEAMNEVLEANSITDVSCSNFTQSQTAFVGYAKDGYPIYSSHDSDVTEPTDLDECYGHTSATTDYPDGIYHYHISNSEAPNLPPCLKGISAQDAFTYE